MPTFQEIIASIANGHAFQKHVVNNGEFDPANAGRYGPDVRTPIDTPDDLADLIQTALNDDATKAAFNVDQNIGIIYNQRLNILIHLNPSSTYADAGTIYRPTGRNKIADYNAAVKELGANGGDVVSARNADDVQAIVQRYADNGTFPRSVTQEMRSTTVQDSSARLNNGPDNATMQSFDAHVDNRINGPGRIKTAAMDAVNNGATVTTEGKTTTITPAPGSNDPTITIEQNKNGTSNVTIERPGQADPTVFTDMSKGETSSLINGASDRYYASVVDEIRTASRSNGVDIAAMGDGPNTVSIYPDDGDRVYDLTKNADGSMTIQVKGMDDVPIGEAIDLPKGYAKQLNTHFKAPSFLDNFPDLRKFTVAVALATGLATGTPDVAQAQTLDQRPVVSYVEEAPASLADEIKATLGANMSDMTIQADDTGRMVIDAHDPNAKDYGIQISPDGKSAEIHVRNADGTIEAVKVDENGMEIINDMLKSDEFSRVGIPSLDDIAPPVDIEGRPIDPEFRITDGPDGRLNIPTEGGDVVARTGGNTADALRQTEATAELLESMRLANAAGDAMRLGKAGGRMAKLSWVGGVAVTGGVAALIHYAHSSQRSLAGELHEQGQLSDEAYEEYLELNNRIETEMQTENAAGQGWLFLVTTPTVEARARSMFDEFSAKHNLSPELHEALGMSMFNGESLSGEFAQEAIDLVPEHMSQMDPEFHELWRVTRELNDAQSAYNIASRPLIHAGPGPGYTQEQYDQRDAREAAAQETLQAAQFEHQREFARLLSDPETGNKLLSMMPQDVLMDMVDETARYHGQGQHPLIEELGQLKQQLELDETGFWEGREINSRIDEIEDELEANPDIVHNYIRNVFGDDGSALGTAEPTHNPEQVAAVESVISDMPDFMQHRVIETAVNALNESGDMDDAHPYLKDLAERYKAVDNSYLVYDRRERINEEIAEIEAEILKNPSILAEHAMESPEVQDVISDYVARADQINVYEGVTPAEMDSALEYIKENALSDAPMSYEADHPMVQELSELHLERSEKSFYEIIDKPNLDERIEQIENELRQNPEILSEHMQRHTGDNLLSNGSNGYIMPDTSDVENVQGAPVYEQSFEGLDPQNMSLPEGPETPANTGGNDGAQLYTPLNGEQLYTPIDGTLDTNFDLNSPTPVNFTPDTGELGQTDVGGYSEDLSSDPDYAEVAMAMERLSAGEALDGVEQLRVEEIINNPDTDPAIIAALEEQYGDQLAEFDNSGDTDTDSVALTAADLNVTQESTASVSQMKV